MGAMMDAASWTCCSAQGNVICGQRAENRKPLTPTAATEGAAV